MYPKVKKEVDVSECVVLVDRPYCEDDRIHRPFSYYVAGGVDLSGTTARKPIPQSFDSAEEVAGDSVDYAADYRTGRFDILNEAMQVSTKSEEREVASAAEV